MVHFFDLFWTEVAKLLESDSNPPLLLVIAGPNGAGKTTCYDNFCRNSLNALFREQTWMHLNPDDLAKEIREANEEEGIILDEKETMNQAWAIADDERDKLLHARESFSMETVFSHEGKISFLEEAKKKGYVIAFIAICLKTVEKSKERVDIRVKKGGHSVPEQKIIARFPKVLKQFSIAKRLASVSLFVDNSEEAKKNNPANYFPFCIVEEGKILYLCDHEEESGSLRTAYAKILELSESQWVKEKQKTDRKLEKFKK